MKTREVFLVPAAVALAFACQKTALAVDLAYEASLAAGHSDNIRRTATQEQEEDIAAAGLNFSLDHVSSRVKARALGDLAYHEYLDDTYDSDLMGNVAADARFAFVQDRFEWVVADNFGQVLSDPFLPQTPENQEDINYFTTGPDLSLALGAQNRLRFAARYSNVTYEDSPFDSDAVSGELAFVRQLSAASSISLNARQEQVEFDEALLNADYDQSEVFVRYQVSGARTHLAADVGYTELDQDAVPGTEDGLLLRLDASRRLSGASVVTFSAGHEFSNSGSAFAATQISGSIGLNAAPGRQTAQPFTYEYVNIGWNFSRNRTGFGVSLGYADQSYEDSPALDQTFSTIGAHFSRQLSTRTALTLDAYYSEGDFRQGADYDELNGALSFEWRLSRNISASMMYDYYDRSSDLATYDATENRIWLTLSYGNGTPRRYYAPPEFAVDERP